MSSTLIAVPEDRDLWSERDYRIALTVWAEPNNPALGDWLFRLADDSPTPVRDLVDRVLHDPTLTGDQRDVAAHIGPRLRTPGVLDDVLAWYSAHPDISFLIPGDPDWPATLNELDGARPYGLWVRGNTELLNRQARVCIGGCRASTSYGDHVTSELAADLTCKGVTIVTGAAYGIEGAATRAALAAGGKPIVILASGIDRPYPTGHGQLIDRAAEYGAVVSEIPPGFGPTRWRFEARNRLLAALSDTVIIPEAGARSRSLTTATRAAQLGRIIGTVPGPITSPASAGCHRLLQETDAYVITQARDILDIM